MNLYMIYDDSGICGIYTSEGIAKDAVKEKRAAGRKFEREYDAWNKLRWNTFEKLFPERVRKGLGGLGTVSHSFEGMTQADKDAWDKASGPQPTGFMGGHRFLIKELASNEWFANTIDYQQLEMDHDDR